MNKKTFIILLTFGIFFLLLNIGQKIANGNIVEALTQFSFGVLSISLGIIYVVNYKEKEKKKMKTPRIIDVIHYLKNCPDNVNVFYINNNHIESFLESHISMPALFTIREDKHLSKCSKDHFILWGKKHKKENFYCSCCVPENNKAEALLNFYNNALNRKYTMEGVVDHCEQTGFLNDL